MNTKTMNTFKKTIYIQIYSQLDEKQLKEIASYLKQENDKYARLFILYLYPDMDMAWATTHFNPNLEIKIYGLDKKAEEKLKNIDLPNGEIIGKWYDRSPLVENSIIIYIKNGKYTLYSV